MVGSLKDLWFARMQTNQACLAMARSNMKPDVYVAMDPEGGARSVFNGVQTFNGKGNIDDPSTWVETNKGVSPLKPHIDGHTILIYRPSQVSAKYFTKPNFLFSCATPIPKGSSHTAKASKGIG